MDRMQWEQFRSRLEAAWRPYQLKVDRWLSQFKSNTSLSPMSNLASTRRSSTRLSQARKRLLTMQLIRFGAIGALVLVVLGILTFFGMFAYFSKDLPKPGEVVRRSGFSTRIFAKNGDLLYDLYDQERRVPIKIDQAPEYLKQATIAIEDKDFYKHEGFDLLTIIRIPYNYVFRQGRVVGGSTLTQQLVKTALLSNERSVIRKFKEFVISMQIERTFTKDQILEMYLNEVPYGGTAYGVGTAAEIYFGKSVSELTVVEAAILAGLPQRPSAYSPFTGKNDTDGTPLWKVRARGVLRRMFEDGYLTDLAYQDALGGLETVEFNGKGSVDITAPHFIFYVRDQLAEMYGDELVETAGFNVTTSLDIDLQKQAQDIVYEEIEKVKDVNITNGSVMVMDPNTGEIIAMVGSKDFSSDEIDGQFNVAVDGLRQPGSSIKPVTYLMMLKRGYTPASMLMDVPTSFAPDDTADAYEPRNYDGQFRGPVNLRNSLASSLNVTAVKSLAIVGVDQFLDQAHKMGFVTLEPTTENMRRFGLAVTLGGAEVHLIDTVSSYSSFANGGRKVEPVSILKVTDRNGRTIYEHKPVQGPEVLSPEEAFLINDILSDNIARAGAFGTNSLLNVSPNVAVKTGTTNDQRDNWAIGWSKDVMVGAWVGNNDNSAMKTVASGVSGATPIWRRVMLAALEKDEYGDPEFEVPSGVEQVEVDTLSGYPKHDEYPSKFEYVIKGTLPSLPDPIHAKLKLCKGEEKLANDARIAKGDYEEKEYYVFREDDPVSQDGKNRWQEAIDAWIAGQTDSKYKPPTEYCGDQDEIYVEMREPDDKEEYDDDEVEVEVKADSGDGIKQIEIWVNGSKRETINNDSYKGKLKLSKGRYEVWAVAITNDGKKKETSKKRIGTGGESWEKPKETPTPSPSPTPDPDDEDLVDLGGGPNFTGPSPTASPTPTPSSSPSVNQ